MSLACQQLTELASSGVAPALRAVDCVSNEMAAAAFGRLFGAQGAMAPVLVLVLSLYIAFFGFSLLTGRSSLGISALTPRMLTLGFVLTFATSWIAYQSVVWNLAIGGPDWIAGVLMGAKGSATQIFGDRIDIVFEAIADASQAASGQGGEQAADGAAAAKSVAPAGAGLFSPDSVMWMGALMLLLGTVGILLASRIALGVLLALGPIFVVMGLFGGTRGLTAGWLRGLVLTALTPLFVVLGGGITLELLVPIVSALVKGAELGEIDGRAAMALFVVAAVHLALMAMVLKVSATLVSGWQVFGLAGRERNDAQGGVPAPAAASAPSVQVQPFATATSASRTPPVSVASAAAMAAESGGQTAGASHSSDRRTVITHVSGGGIAPMSSAGSSRARGIGSTFRGATNDGGRAATRISGSGPVKEKLK